MKKSRMVYIKLLLSAFFWGCSAIASKLLLQEVSPIYATFIRFFIAGIVFMIYLLPSFKNVKITFKEHIKLFILGIVGITLCYLLYFQGLFFSSIFNAAIIESTIPLITLCISVLIRKESFKLTQFSGFIVSYFGIIIIITQCNLARLISLTFNIGDILLILSTVCFGLYNVLYRNANLSVSSNFQTFFILVYGTIGILPWLVFDQTFSLVKIFELSIAAWGYILLLAVGSSVLAYLFFNEGIEALGASKASGFINYVPVITIVLSMVLLNEIPDFSQIIGAIVVLGGIYLSHKNFLDKGVL